MSRLLLIALLTLAAATAATAGAHHRHHPDDPTPVSVPGYVRADGHAVAPYYRSWPNGDGFDNWGSRGNVNPVTGKVGRRDPEPTYHPAPAYSHGLRRTAPMPRVLQRRRRR